MLLPVSKPYFSATLSWQITKDQSLLSQEVLKVPQIIAPMSITPTLLHFLDPIAQNATDQLRLTVMVAKV